MDKVIVKNSAWLLSAQSLVKVISFFYVIFLARFLGVEDFGLYVVASSYFALVSSLADLGISRFITRQLAVDKKGQSQLLSTAIFLRMSILAIFFAIFSIGMVIFDPDLTRRNLSMLAVVAVLPQSLSLTLDAAFIALLKVNLSALGFLFLSFATTTFGLAFVLMGFGSYGAVLGLVTGQFLYALMLALIAYKQKISWLAGPDDKLLIKSFAQSLPYGFLAIMGLIYFKVDTLLLSYLRGNYETGIYGAAYKFLEASVFIPSGLATVTFPILAKLQGVDREKIKNIYSSNLKVMALLGIAVAFLYIFILPVIISTFLPSYSSSITVIKILALSIPLLFIYVPASEVLLSSQHHLKPVILISFLPLMFNIVTNLIFIPLYGFLAAAWITVISDVVSFLTIFIYTRKYYFK